jgi:hypothetical protein
MKTRFLGSIAAAFLVTGIAAFMVGCEESGDDPVDETASTNAAPLSLTTANLEGVWNLVATGTVRSVAGAVVLDSHGNVTGFTGPVNLSSQSGSFYVGVDGVDVGGFLKYACTATNGAIENNTIYFQGHFLGANQVLGSHTHSWSPSAGVGYDTGTFLMTK